MFHIKNASFFFISEPLLKDLDKEYFSLTHRIKKQMANTKATRNFEEASGIGDSSLKIMFVVTLLLNFVSKGIMDHLV